ncbi:MAG TPA: hypothetical protein VFQ35_03535, partial [Polyangiaceae bacterium]|nr:hypothetical protein [Polyangiaceae bacterium]
MGVVERVIPAAALGYGIFAAWFSLAHGVPGILVTVIAVLPLGLIALALERVFPERTDYSRADQPVRVELAHYLFDYNVGYALALGACALLDWGLARYSTFHPWPNEWPLVVQIAVAA